MSVAVVAAPMLVPARPAELADVAGVLWRLGRAFRGRLSATYGLLAVENLVRLSLPLALGAAITDLLAGGWNGIVLLITAELGYVALGTARRMFDTRTYATVYVGLAARVVAEQRQAGVDESAVAARVRLVRNVVDVFERDIPVALFAAFSLVGGLTMLAWYDLCLAAAAVAAGGPVWLAGKTFARACLTLTRRLNDDLERELAVIRGGDPEAVGGHYRRFTGWQVKLSDAQAWCFAKTEVCLLALTAVVVIRCGLSAADAGIFFAVFRYVTMVAGSLDGMVLVAQQAARLRDVCGRLTAPESGEEFRPG
jgi:hypothetical protein